MRYVYLIQSIVYPDQRYVGLTWNVDERLAEHNRGNSIHTNKFKPWKLIATFGFDDEQKAFDFERYLKHGSGHAFAKKHFW
jgi:putative endonuclease